MIYRFRIKIASAFFLIAFIFSPSSHATSTVAEVIENGVRRFFRISYDQASRQGVQELPSDVLMEIATLRVSEDILSRIGSMPRERALQEIQASLDPVTVARFMFLKVDEVEVPDVSRMIRMLGALERGGERLALVRRSVAEQWAQAWKETDSGIMRLLRGMRKRFERITLRGDPLDPKKVLDHLLVNGDDPARWIEHIRARVSSGTTIEVEELAASLSLLEPVNDLIFAEALSTSVLFRERMVMEVWRSAPQAIHFFFDRFKTVLVPHLKDRLSLVRFMEAFPQTVFGAFRPNRRSLSIFQGLRQSYSRDMAVREIQMSLIRFLNIGAIERSGILGELTYPQFLEQAIRDIEAGGFLYRHLNVLKLRRLRHELSLFKRYQEAFQSTLFDVFHGTYEDLARILPESFLKGLTEFHGVKWVRRNLAMGLVTSLYLVVAFYFQERPEEIPDPQTLCLPDEDMIRDITIKIDLVERRLQFVNDSKTQEIMRAWIEELKAEREKYRR